MGRKYDFDYIVIGSGPAGRAAALNLAKKKKKVAIVEGNVFGGADLATRDLPYAVNSNFAKTFLKIKNFPATATSDFHFNFPTLISHQNYVTSLAINEEKNLFAEKNITILSGHAHFLDKNTIAINTNRFTAKNFIIATGSKLKTGEISGLDSVNYLTPETALKLPRLPKCAIIVGGGSTGCEIASYYAALGVKVIILERGNRILLEEDKEVSVAITEHFTSDLGIMVIPNARVVALEQDSLSKRVIFVSNGQEKLVRVDCIVLATGSEPSLDLGLENAGVKYKRSGILVDKLFETTTDNIYAIGDCINRENSSTELSEYEAMLLTSNILNKTKASPNYTGFIREINTPLAVATVGVNDRDLVARDKKCKKSIIYLKDLPAGNIENKGKGFVKVIAKDNRLIGATIVAENAGLLIEELALAIRQRLSLNSIIGTPHLKNSDNLAVQIAVRKLTEK